MFQLLTLTSELLLPLTFGHHADAFQIFIHLYATMLVIYQAFKKLQIM